MIHLQKIAGGLFESLDAWIEETEIVLPALLEQIGEEEKSWQPLNAFFLSELQS